MTASTQSPSHYTLVTEGSFRVFPPLRSLNLTLQAKIFLGLMVVQFLMVIGAVIGYCDQRDWQSDACFYGTLIVIFAGFMLVYAIDGVLNENRVLLSSFIGTAVVMLGYLVYAVIRSDSVHENRTFFIVVLSVAVGCFVTDAILAILVWRGFGWRMFIHIGADPNLQRIFRVYLATNGLIKLDVQWAALAVTTIIWEVRKSPALISLVVLWAVGTIIVSFFVLIHFIPHERWGKMIAYTIFSAAAIPAGVAAICLIPEIPFELDRAADVTVEIERFVIVIGIFMVVRLAVVVANILCIGLFGRGMEKGPTGR